MGDVHISRMDEDFLKYINNPLTLWAAVLGAVSFSLGTPKNRAISNIFRYRLKFSINYQSLVSVRYIFEFVCVSAFIRYADEAQRPPEGREPPRDLKQSDER